MLVDVAIPNTKFDFLTYKTTKDVSAGDLVLIPLREKFKHGVVLRTNSQHAVKGLKEVKEIIERRFLPASLLTLYQWIADYYIATHGEVLTLAFPSKVLKKYEAATEDHKSAILARAPEPTYHQNYAITKIIGELKKKHYATFLLWGITGSGKTEVYLRTVAEVLKEKGRALVLVPEISMTPLLLSRFKERFGNQVATIHSGLSDRERKRVWFAVKNGEYQVIIGPRSGVFLPIPDLRIIIVDEEHDHSYKEHQRSVKYHARDVAVMRGKIENAVVVLGSATPQIESYYNAGIGKYHLLTLKERIDKRPLPHVDLIDLRNETHKFVSKRLEEKLSDVLSKSEQAILFLNRRGFAPSLICPNCGFTARCPYCHLPLVYHKQLASTLSCHICDYNTRMVSWCPQCGKATLLYHGAGTQRIEEIVGKIIDHMPALAAERKATPVIVRMDRDSVRKKGETEKILQAFEKGTAKILLGTQLVTKGFDFPNVTLVGIVNADTIMNLPDFRSGERTFQVLTQVAGRSGRGEKPGEVLIQTFHPEQYAILFGQLQDYPKFYRREMELREELNFPPFSKLILLRFNGPKEASVWTAAKKVFDIIRKVADLKVFGPNRSYYYNIKRNYRVYILCKTDIRFSRSKLDFLKHIRTQGVKLEIDVDPIDVF